MRLFFYGTLCDAEVRTRVLGRRGAAALVPVEARAPRWRAVYAAGKHFPVLVPAHGQAAEGVLVEGVGPRALARLDAFEAGYRREAITVEVAGGKLRAGAYLPRRRLRAGYRPFALGPWRARCKKDYLKRIAGTG